jgi:Flp pilus assembly protein TadG
MKKFASSFASSTIQKLKGFHRDEAGNIAMLMGAAAIPLMLCAGAAIDMVRITREQASFHAAVDSAVLAIAADDRSAISGQTPAQQAESIATLEAFARDFLRENYTAQGGDPSAIELDLGITGQAIDIHATLEFPTTIMRLAGIDSVALSFGSQVKKAMKPVELVLVMDTTGSMATDNKIGGARDAARALLTTVYGGSPAQVPESEYLRVALVPFAAGVRLNATHADFNLNWIDTTGLNPLSHLNFTDPAWNNFTAWGALRSSANTQMTWNGCVETRMRGPVGSGTDYHVNDTAPNAATPATLFPAYFAYDPPTVSSGESPGTSYIGTSGTPNENTGLTAAQQSSTTDAGYLVKQKNQAKYLNRVISAETAATSPAGPWVGCAKSKLVPMTYKRSNIEAGITAMTAAGNTLIGEGLAWGMRAISNTEPLTQVEGTTTIPAATIAPYGDIRWQKIMVLMTDGDNDLGAGNYRYNETTYSSYGRGGEVLASNRFGTNSSGAIMNQLDADMLAVCAKIKANDVALYVTSFGNGVSATTRSRLQACATDASHYQHATSNADLQAFFNHIGEDVLNKMVYVSK